MIVDNEEDAIEADRDSISRFRGGKPFHISPPWLFLRLSDCLPHSPLMGRRKPQKLPLVLVSIMTL